MSNKYLFSYDIRITLSPPYLPNGLSHYRRLAAPAARTQMERQDVTLSTNRSVVLMGKPMVTAVYSMKQKGKRTWCFFGSESTILTKGNKEHFSLCLCSFLSAVRWVFVLRAGIIFNFLSRSEFIIESFTYQILIKHPLYTLHFSKYWREDGEQNTQNFLLPWSFHLFQ